MSHLQNVVYTLMPEHPAHTEMSLSFTGTLQNELYSNALHISDVVLDVLLPAGQQARSHVAFKHKVRKLFRKP